MFNLILLGDPASGKATQGAKLAKKFKLYDFDMGVELFKHRRRDKKFDAAMRRTIDKGYLAPTNLARIIVKEVLKRVSPSKGILFDGHPKMLEEAKILSRLLRKQKRVKPLFLYIKIPKAETIRRINLRKGYFGGKHGKRPDDMQAALKNRASYYKYQLKPAAKFFRSIYYSKTIDGMGTQQQVHQRILKAIQQWQSGEGRLWHEVH